MIAVKKSVVAGALSLALGGTASAADLPVKAPVLPPSPAFDWSGVYLGVHAGYGGGMKDWSREGMHFPAQGFLGGAQIGINKQLASFVFGLEMEGSWANIGGSQAVTNGSMGPFFLGVSSLSASSRIE